MAQHTIAPWHIVSGTTSGREIIAPEAPESRRRVARCGGKDRVMNAFLIAAAPDLLSALQLLDQVLDFGLDAEGARDWAKQMGMGEEGADDLLAVCQQARAAIAKAEGRS